MHCLETAGLCHRFSNNEIVLDGIDLQVPEGSIYGFLGPNGAGKTTTLRLVLGLLKKQQGTISIFGKRFDAHRIEILRNVGSLIESPSLYEHLTARENMTLLQKVHQCPKACIAEVLDLVGLPETGNKRTGDFSLGMRQRLSIALAMLHNPSLLILDEPTNGLDPNGIVEMRQLLMRLNAVNGITIMLSSHLLAEIEKLVSHVGIIHRGRMVFQGTMCALNQRQQQVLSVCIGTSNDVAALELIVRHAPGARMTDGKIAMPPLSNQRIATLNRLLVDSGLDVHEIRPVRNDLETIFMDLVGEPQS